LENTDLKELAKTARIVVEIVKDEAYSEKISPSLFAKKIEP